MGSLKLINREEAGALASPLRRQMLERLQQPTSASALARELGMSRQRVGYHMRELQRQGFIEPAGERPVRGLKEKLFRARAVTWVLDPQSLDQPEQEAGLRDRFSWSTLMDLTGRMLKDLTRLRKGADRAGKRLATLSIETEIAFADPASRQAFSEELTDTVNRLVARYNQSDSPNARAFRLVLGAYPTPQSEETEHDPTND